MGFLFFYMNNRPLPTVMERLQALMIDAIVLFFFMYFTSIIFDRMNEVPDKARMAAFIFIFFLYAPLMVSFLGGTLGHRAMKLRVKRYSKQTKNVLLPLAFFRFAVKALLGWISILSISAHSEGRAIHDLVSSSIVIHKEK